MRQRAAEIESRLMSQAGAAATSNSDERAALVLAAGELGGAVLGFLNDPSYAVRICAALAPGLRGHPDAIAVLLDAFNRHVTQIDQWFTNPPPQFFGWPRFYVVDRLVETVRNFDQLVDGAVALLSIADKHTVDRDWGQTAGGGVSRWRRRRQIGSAAPISRGLGGSPPALGPCLRQPAPVVPQGWADIRPQGVCGETTILILPISDCRYRS
jgi:hypothetical protein